MFVFVKKNNCLVGWQKERCDTTTRRVNVIN